jgi:hypothetical protein
MKYVPRMPIPWDMVVFLTITTTGFGLSVKRVFAPPSQAVAIENARELTTQAASSAAPSATAELGCLDKSLPTRRLLSDAGTIRLRGKICHLSRTAALSFDGVHVKNLSNGFEGTVFYQGKDASFVTDYVLLQPGKNQIEIEWRESRSGAARKILAEVVEQNRYLEKSAF